MNQEGARREKLFAFAAVALAPLTISGCKSRGLDDLFALIVVAALVAIVSYALILCALLGSIVVNVVLVARRRPNRVVGAASFFTGGWALLRGLYGVVRLGGGGIGLGAVFAWVALVLGAALCAVGAWHYRRCVRAAVPW